jgi:hypothetical protein
MDVQLRPEMTVGKSQIRADPIENAAACTAQ